MKLFFLVTCVFVVAKAANRHPRQIFNVSVNVSTATTNIPLINVTNLNSNQVATVYANYSCAPANCLEIKLSGASQGSGIYTIQPRSWFNVAPFDVYCDMETDGGGWIVLQRRSNFTVQELFNRSWGDYRRGFGNFSEDFWIGLENIYLLTVQDQVSLRIDLDDSRGDKSHGIYRTFKIGGRDQKYTIFPAEFRGPAGDPLWVGTTFTTHDESSVKKECLNRFSGGWWLNDDCPPGSRINNLNGIYSRTDAKKFDWTTWNADLVKTEMKIRPSDFPKCGNGGSHYYYE